MVYMPAIAVLVVHMFSIRLIVIDVTAHVVGVVRKDRHSEAEQSKENRVENDCIELTIKLAA